MKPSDVIYHLQTAFEKLTAAVDNLSALRIINGETFQSTLQEALADTHAGLNALQALSLAEQLIQLPQGSALPGNIIPGQSVFNQKSAE